VLLLAAIPDHVEATVALAVFALFTAISMSIASTGYGWVLARGAVRRGYGAFAPVMGAAGLAFGVWYGLAALDALPYAF
jgi:uncharacterized BrkB/YihY/UPF0761 family membrane protein